MRNSGGIMASENMKPDEEQPTKTKRCEACPSRSVAHVTYGLYEQFKKGRAHRELDLCRDHMIELWSRIAGAVGAQMMHYVIRPPDRVKARVQSDGK